MGIELDILSHTAKLVGIFEFYADVSAFVNLDMVYKFNEYVACQLFNVLIFEERRQKRAFRIHTIFKLIPFCPQGAENGIDGLGLLFVVLAHVSVIGMSNLAVFPVLIESLFVAQ